MNYHLSYLFLFLFGVMIGVLLNILFEPKTPSIVLLEKVENSIDDVKKLRIFCFLNTSPVQHSRRAVHIVNTWSKQCDKLFFASTLTDMNLGALGFNVSNDHWHMWGKEKLMLQFIYKHFLDDYDWFFKGDDDTFLMVENLRFMLSAHSTDDPIYFGYKFNTTKHKWGYFQGGSGYAMSRKTVQIFAEQILTNAAFFQTNIQNDSRDGICHIETDSRVEDWEISICLDQYNVYAGDSRDLVKRERFLMWTPEVHLFHLTPSWYTGMKYYWSDEGMDCCSNYTIAYHYINAREQYKLYFLIYRLGLYGVRRTFPPPPKKYEFSNIAYILDQERVNKTLRGWQ